MATYKRQELPGLLQAIAKGETTQIYLIFGDRYLCQQAADQILNHLLPDEGRRSGSLVLVDGDQEEPGKTLNQLRTYSLFGGRRVIQVMDSRLLHSTVIAKHLWAKGVKQYQNNDLEGARRYLLQVLDIGGMTSDDLEDLPDAGWKTKLGFTRPEGNLTWVSEVLGQTGLPDDTAPSTGGRQDITDLYVTAFDEGLPSGNILILVTDSVDKRKKFYKYIATHGSVLDLAVDTGTNKAATDSQKEVLSEIVRKSLAASNKKMDPRTLDIFLERVGFHPLAAAMESEKLALYCEERQMITLDDLNEVIGRTREEAVYELSEAFSNRDLMTSLLINARLLENGLHPLVIVATLRNHLKKMLIISSMQDLDRPVYSPGLSFQAFKGGYLERLKSSRPNDGLPKDLPGHPFALYMMFQKAENFRTPELTGALSILLETEYRLKSTGLSEKIILESMFFKLLGPPPAQGHKAMIVGR
jgi:DNA polymerase-3 subunit delta